MTTGGRVTPVAGRCSATALLLGGLLPGLAALVLRDWRDGATAVLAQLLALAPFIVGRGLRLRRLLPCLVAAASVTWSTWLFGTRDLTVAAGTGTRVLALAVPGVLLLRHLDPARLGDELGQWIRLPGRPVLAAAAAVGQVEALSADWQSSARARRARGLGPGRSPLARGRAAASMTVTLLVGALRRAGTLSDAMSVRGLGAVRHRTWTVPARWAARDTALALVTLALTALPIALRLR